MTSSPDLLIVGRIATLAGDRGPGWVEAVAVSGGRVVAAGRRRDVEGTCGTGTRRIELAPHEAAIPGLTDAHLHLASAGLSGPRRMIDTMPEAMIRIPTAYSTLFVPIPSESGPTMMIGRKLAVETSMFRTPNTRPRTSSGSSSWSCVWDGMATNA